MVGSFYEGGKFGSFDQIRIGLASPEKVLNWSYGEVKRAETINYRTLKPERDGLFCARIFGPVRDYECICGKYKYIRHRGMICEKCGVEVTLSRVRRERMGHITLAAPVAHVWFFKSLPSRIGILLGLTQKALERVIYFERYVVIEPGLTDLSRGDILTEEEYQKHQREEGVDAFTARMGAEAIQELLATMDLEAELAVTLDEIKNAEVAGEAPPKLVKKYRMLDSFIVNKRKVKPEWMVMSVLPVLPPALRPLVPMDGGRFAASDSNELYRRVLNRNSRLKRLMDISAPDIIVRNEKRMLQEAVDALFDNGRTGRIVLGSNRQPLRSLSSMIKGKQGRFRHHLLGKRVDYSGRSVIVAAPYLALDECALPKEMALEMFKPFVYAELLRAGVATVRQAKRMVERSHQDAWDALDKVVKGMVILLNRAPTLHRLSLQAFRVVLTPHRAIGLSLMVNTPYNFDHDGDTMTVHLPLSPYPLIEGFVLLMSTNNILGLANGKPIVIPTQDMVLGLYYLTLDNPAKVGVKNVKFYGSVEEVETALSTGVISVHDPILYRCKELAKDEDKEVIVEREGRFETTPGRVLLHNIIPKSPELNFALLNKSLDQKDLIEIVALSYRYCGQKKTVRLLEQMQQLGLEWAFKSGISFGKDDMLIPGIKEDYIANAEAKVREYERQFMDGLITESEKYNKVINEWSRCSDRIADVMMQEISRAGEDGSYNSIYTMLDSGARGSPSQVKQLLGMRGLMTTPSGKIIEVPIVSNFKEGLSVIEYFNSSHGARKGLADTALKTASSGYLTRRLVDVAQDCAVTEVDCGTKEGLLVSTVWSDFGIVEVSLEERIIGRVLLEDVLSPDGEVLLKGGQYLDEESARAVVDNNVTELRIRSPITCEVKHGVCAMCYGRDMARHEMVNIGEPVGIVAAQSIGEPGTQLTMRTFHAGGAAQLNQNSSIQSPCKGTLHFENADFAKNKNGHLIVVGRNMELIIKDNKSLVRLRKRVVYGSRVLVVEGSTVRPGEIIVEWDPFTIPIIADVSGKVKCGSAGESGKVADQSSWSILSIVDEKDQTIKFKSSRDASYLIPAGCILSVQDGQMVFAGDVLGRIPKEASRTGDITGGMPRVADLFEARQPKDAAIIASQDGVIKLTFSKSRLKITLIGEDGSEIDYPVARHRQILVQDGDVVCKGDYLVDGRAYSADILSIMGLEAFANFLVSEIQSVYRLQGVVINDKHIEVIGRCMMQQVEVLDSGDSQLFKGEKVDKSTMQETNTLLESQGKEPAKFRTILLGITKANLQARSFISAASFQETTRVLTDAAVLNKKDDLEGLKENMISARLIPVGTGLYFHKYRRLAAQKDRKILELKKQKYAERIDNEGSRKIEAHAND